MNFERTKDSEAICAIVSNPRVYGYISEDGSPDPLNWEPMLIDSVYYLIVREKKLVLGLFALAPSSGVCMQLHVCLLPTAYGALAKEAAKGLLNWVWAKIPTCMRVTGEVPVFNRLALKYGKEALGMTEYGRNIKAFLKDGILHDTILLGISRPGV